MLIRTGQARQCSTCKHHHHPQWLAATQVYFFVHTKYRFGLAVGQLHMTIALTPRPRVTEQARSGVSPVTVTGKIQSVAKVAIEVSIHLEGAQHTVHVSLAKVGHMTKSRRTRVCVPLCLTQRVKVDMSVNSNIVNHRNTTKARLLSE